MPLQANARSTHFDVQVADPPPCLSADDALELFCQRIGCPDLSTFCLIDGSRGSQGHIRLRLFETKNTHELILRCVARRKSVAG